MGLESEMNGQRKDQRGADREVMKREDRGSEERDKRTAPHTLRHGQWAVGDRQGLTQTKKQVMKRKEERKSRKWEIWGGYIDVVEAGNKKWEFQKRLSGVG